LPSGPAHAAASPSVSSPLSGAHTHTPTPPHQSHSFTLPQPPTHTQTRHGMYTRTRHTPHAPMPRTAQVQTRQVHQLAQRIRQCCCCSLVTQTIAWCPHTHTHPNPIHVSHTASLCYSRPHTLGRAYTHATHTPLPHATYCSSPASSGAQAFPADPPMLLPPLHPAHCLVPKHTHISYNAPQSACWWPQQLRTVEADMLELGAPRKHVRRGHSAHDWPRVRTHSMSLGSTNGQPRPWTYNAPRVSPTRRPSCCRCGAVQGARADPRPPCRRPASAWPTRCIQGRVSRSTNCWVERGENHHGRWAQGARPLAPSFHTRPTPRHGLERAKHRVHRC